MTGTLRPIDDAELLIQVLVEVFHDRGVPGSERLTAGKQPSRGQICQAATFNGHLVQIAPDAGRERVDSAMRRGSEWLHGRAPLRRRGSRRERVQHPRHQMQQCSQVERDASVRRPRRFKDAYLAHFADVGG